jgi:hypothetical protein
VIPPEVFGNILVELKKRKITNLATVSLSQIRAILKKLRLSKYYEHTSFIMSQLNGKPTKPFDHALEESIKKMFVQIQAPSSHHTIARISCHTATSSTSSASC